MRTAEPKQKEPRIRRVPGNLVRVEGEEKRSEPREVAITGPEAETNILLSRLAPVYAQHVEFYAKEYDGAPGVDPRQKADGFYEYSRDDAAETPPDKITWRHLSALAQTDLGAALDVWEKVKQAAREQLATGARTSEAVFPNATPMQRAQHCVLREEMEDGWQPRNGIEHALVDMLAITFGLWLHWTEIAHTWATGFIEDNIKNTYTGGLNWKSPRVDEAEAVDKAHRLADGYNRQFLRTLRQLRDLRRYVPPVIVNNGGQVNVANQQVNVSRKGDE